MSITQRTIAGLETTGKIQFIRDSSLSGFGIKVTAQGKASFIVEARVRGGRTVRRTIGSVDLLSLEDAKIEARQMLLDLKRGVDIARVQPPAPPASNSLQEALEAYLRTRVRLKETTKRQYRKVVEGAFPELLGREVNGIAVDDIATAYRRIASRASASYAAIALRTLRAILNSTDIAVNPVKRFLKTSGFSATSTTRTRYLSDQEISRVMDFSRDPATGQSTLIGDLLMFYLLTGCRKGEALGLTKRHHSAEAGTITFTNTKNGLDHTIPLEGWIKSIIDRRVTNASEEDPRLFPYTENEYRTALKKASRELAFSEPWTTHDLRRTFAEHCQLIGFDHHVIGSALNHTPVGVTQRSYLGGGLAKREILRDVYSKLQRQFLFYHDGFEARRLPDGMAPFEWDTPT